MELASSDAMAVRFALPVLHSPLSFLGRLKPFFSFWKRKKRMGSKTLPVCAERRQPPLGRGGLCADEGIGPYKRNRAHGGKTIKRMPCSSLYPLDQKRKDATFVASFFLERVTRLARAAQRPDTHAGTERPHRGLSSADADALFEPLSAEPKRKDATFVASFFLERVTRLARAAQRPDTHAGTERPHRGLSSADADALFEPLSAEPKRKDATFVASFFLERVTRLELATSTLARWRSTG